MAGVTHPVLTHPLLTPPEFAAVMGRAGWRAPMELINGEVVVIPPTGGDASLAQTQLVHRLSAWQDAHAGGGLVLSDVFVRVGDAYLAPDVAWWSAGREPDIGIGAIGDVPDLVIEVLSPSTRENDLGPKRVQYLAAGVQELWLVDPADATVLGVTPAGDVRLGGGGELASPLLPGLRLRIADIFA